jgi:transposase/regulator of replication initiation timing
VQNVPIKQTLAKLEEKILQLTERLSMLEEENKALKAENFHLKNQVIWLKRQLFGSKSEKVDVTQLMLELEQNAEESAPVVPESKTLEITYTKNVGAPKKVLPPKESFKHLSVKETITILPEEVEADPGSYKQIGVERKVEVDVNPPEFFLREIIRPKFVCVNDKMQAPVVAPAPKAFIEGGYASAGLVAYCIENKFADHLPAYRQEQIFKRQDLNIPRKRMCEWFEAAAAMLTILYEDIRLEILNSGCVQMDETPIRYLDKNEPGHGSKRGYMWLLCDPNAKRVYFDWASGRGHANVGRILGEEYCGVLQSDGYEAYSAYAAAHEKVLWVGCWAHARRKFFDALEMHPQEARQALGLIGQLYEHERTWREKVEAHVRGRPPPQDERGRERRKRALQRAHLLWRRKHFPSVLEQLREKTQSWASSPRVCLPQSALGKAIRYLHNHWEALGAHAQRGDTFIDNNVVENAVRPCALGRKNWLFIGSEAAGKTSAVLYTLVSNCRLHGVNVWAYLMDVLVRLSVMKTNEDRSSLLPWNWKAALSKSASEPGNVSATPAVT